MKKESGTHRSMGKTGSLGNGLKNGVSDVMPIKHENGKSDGDTARQPAVKNGSIAV